ncbi:hypothetical protein VOLCADRAFT_95633 [Volvox carteri f. nagariensis]|uniref:Rab-GAP TBC domain-containing protein n=1 Tax=Volvox carteri f. nagariensis TaxID=3068 RepID=D8U7U3_VOLCA|nr:uncharacterized protein VOLCADRAFT_95633 [Volvox carteri f. nagariensis]EFJ44153.1 hypothetical protein VOLCADRAFT_95633 [Volvox carteri f. nagariensis]|eukprot:XP_002954747.1 hypothetical protein VOLCADRAFT_95633 [Volvox carteri f. nagariensis]
MLKYNIPAVSITGQHGRIWTTKPTPGHSGLVAVLQVPASKVSEAVRSPDFTVAAMERRADLLVTADTRGQVYVFDIRQNRFSCLDRTGFQGTAALIHGPRVIFVAFADSSIRCYDASKGTVTGVLREHRSPVRHLEINRELNELLSTSVDGVLVWDIQKLRRKRVLGSGPYGALQASYTADGQAIVTQFKVQRSMWGRLGIEQQKQAKSETLSPGQIWGGGCGRECDGGQEDARFSMRAARAVREPESLTDGSFFIWSVGNFALVRSFTLPVAPPLRPLQTTFCLSPDGQLLVSCGPTLPVLLVYSVIGGFLRYGIGLPAPPSQLDTGRGVGEGAAGAAAATAGAAAAKEAAAGAAALPALGADGTGLPAAAAALAAKLSMAIGVRQVAFLPDSATVAAMLTDGSIAFVDVLSCSCVGAVPYSFPNRPDGSFTLDARAQHMALTADGKLNDLAAAVALEHLRQHRAQEQLQLESAKDHQQQQPFPAAEEFEERPDLSCGLGRGAQAKAWIWIRNCGGSGCGGAERGPPGLSLAQDPAGVVKARKRVGTKRTQQAAGGRPPVSGVAMQLRTGSGAAVGRRGGGGGVKPDAASLSLNRTRLEALLEAFGEYPAKYRLMIWEFLLQLPHNAAAFACLAGLGLHPAFKDVQSKLPLANRALAQRLAATLSQLAHWCPVFAESSFLPDLIFPFVKLFASASALHRGSPVAAAGARRPRSSAALDERCFETVATLLSCGWMRGWVDLKLGCELERVSQRCPGFRDFKAVRRERASRTRSYQDLLSLHDAPLAAHFNTYRGGMAGVVWPHLATLWTELLTRSDWLRLWDHCITAGPDLLYMFVCAYFISLRVQIMAMDTDHKLANWLAGPPTIDMGEILKVAYLLRDRTPEQLRPVPNEWQPLPQGPTYVEFKDFPAGAVELFAADRARIKEAEDAIMRRRAVVSELELRTRAVALQAASLSSERQQLAALEEQRRAMLRQLEAETASEMARLDDRAKEEKLRQIAAMEKAYQANLLEVRATWQRELEFARAEMAHKRALAAQQVRSRQEDEQIKALEFHAQQRMREMEDDVRRTAVASAVRDELLSQQMEAEAKQRAKLKEWEIEDESRKQRLQHEQERRAQLAVAAEESAARSAAAREAQKLALQIDDHVMTLDGQRRLRRMAEDAALVTAEARAAEEARLAARAAAEQEALRLRARADMAWYEAEQMRREQLLEQERQQMEAAAEAARRKLADTEAAARTMAVQAELLERRRHLERQNAAEEAHIRRLVGVMAVERGRDAVLVSDLEAKEDEMKANLVHYARLGSLQREVEASEAAAAVTLLAKLDEQQRRELVELRKLHDEALQRLSKEMEGQATEAAVKRRSELLEDQLAAIRAHQQAFERRKQELGREMVTEKSRILRKATEGGTSAAASAAAAAAAAAAAGATSSETSREDTPPPPPPPPPQVPQYYPHDFQQADPPPQPPQPEHSAGERDLPARPTGGAAGARSAAAVAADAARHTDMVLRALGLHSQTSSPPTATGSSTAGTRGILNLFTPRHGHIFDFLSDSNLTPESNFSSVTTSSAPSPERPFFFRKAPVVAVAEAMAPPGTAATAAAAPDKDANATTTTTTTTTARAQEQLESPSTTAVQSAERTQESAAGGWPPPARVSQAVNAPQRPSTAPAAGTPRSVVSGTASSDTVTQSGDTPVPRSTSAGSGAVGRTGATAAASCSHITPGSSSSTGGGGGCGAASASAIAAAAAAADRPIGSRRSSWPWGPLSPLHEEGLVLADMTPSTSPSSFLPLITPSRGGATSAFLGSSMHAPPNRGPLEHSAAASITAAAALHRAAMAAVGAASPSREQQQHQQQPRRQERSGTSNDLRAILGVDEHVQLYGPPGHRRATLPAAHHPAFITSGSSFLESSLDGAVGLQLLLQKAQPKSCPGAIAPSGAAAGAGSGPPGLQQPNPCPGSSPAMAGLYSSMEASDPAANTRSIITTTETTTTTSPSNSCADQGGGGGGGTGSGTDFSSGSSPWPPPPPPGSSEVGLGLSLAGRGPFSSHNYSPASTEILSGSGPSTASLSGPSDAGGAARLLALAPGGGAPASSNRTGTGPARSGGAAPRPLEPFASSSSGLFGGTSSSGDAAGGGSGGAATLAFGSRLSPRGEAARNNSSSSAGFASLRASGSSSGVLLGGLADSGAASPSSAAAAAAALAAAVYSSYSSDITSDSAGADVMASLRPLLGSVAAALYGSSSSSGGTGTGTGTGGGAGSSSRNPPELGRSSLTRTSITSTTALSTNTPGSSDGYLPGMGPLALRLSNNDSSSGLAGLWSGAPATAAAAGSSTGASTDDVSEVLRLLRLSAQDDLGLLSSSSQGGFPLVLPKGSYSLQQQHHSQSHALPLPPLPPPPPPPQQQQWQDPGGDDGGRGEAADHGRRRTHDQVAGTEEEEQQQQQRLSRVMLLPSNFSDPHSKAFFPLATSASGGLDAAWSMLGQGAPAGGAGLVGPIPSVDAAAGGQGFGSCVGSSNGSSRHGSELGAPPKAAADSAGGGGGGAPRATAAAAAARPAASVGRAASGGGCSAAQSDDNGDDEAEDDGGDDDEYDDDVSIAVAVATPYPLGSRPSPDASPTPGQDERPPPANNDGVRGGRQSGGTAANLSADGAASELFGSSPRNSIGEGFLAGAQLYVKKAFEPCRIPTTPGGVSDLSAELRRMGLTWGHGDDSTAAESMSPSTITGLTSMYDDDAPMTVATHASSDTVEAHEHNRRVP